MEPWYSEAVADAVREAKTRRALLVVYVRDTSEQSQAADQLWSAVWPKFPDTNKFVALRLDKDSQACTQFMAIFKVQTFPTIYFINGQNGQSLKVVETPLENAEQLEKIFSESLALVNPTETVEASPPVTKSVDERVAEARARLKELQEKREDEAKEKEKQDEMVRRRLGQQMLLDKQKKDEELIRKQAEEVRRDKLEQQKLQEKLKAQIQQDREEKRRKYEQNQSQPARPPPTTAEPINPPVNYTRSRLQFRLTDGSFYTEDFPAEAHMSDVYAYLQETLPADQYRRGSYVLRTTHTRVTLTREETGTLKELELVPTAVLLVIPRGNASSPSTALTTATGMFQPISLVFAWLMMQFNFLYQLITRRVFGGGGGAAAATAGAVGDRRSAARGQQPSSTKAQQGNFRTDSTASSTIRRFHNTQDDSDDEEKRTWNGNSTQQM